MMKPPHLDLPANQPKPTRTILLALVILLVLLAACRLANLLPTPTSTTQPVSVINTVTPDSIATLQVPTPPDFGIDPTSGPCGFTWASKPLPELSDQLRARLSESGLPVSAARAEAYGEDCLYSDGTLAYFAAMQTDYRIALTVSDLNDVEALGNLLTQTLQVIDRFPVKETPGPNPGYIGVTFQAGEQVENLWFQRAQSDKLRAQGLNGTKLYEALKAK